MSPASVSPLQKGELKRLRELETFVRRLAFGPLWALQPPDFEDAQELRRLAGLEEAPDREDLRRLLAYSERRCEALQAGLARAKEALADGAVDEAYEHLGIAAVRSQDLRRAYERMTAEDKTVVLERHLGPQGRLISRSKSGYKETHKHHLVIFNAQISVAGETHYRGDLDLTVDEPLLKEIAREIGDLYVLTEHEKDFKPDDPQRGRHFVYWTDGVRRQVGDRYWRHFGWDEDALLRRPPER